jgi:sn-glycerol 3-phosphate transport system permease protein
MASENRGILRRTRPGRRRWRDAGLAYLLLLPSLVLFGIFAYYPFLKNFKLPFYRESQGFGRFAGKERYVGWTQWHEVLTSEEFKHALGVTVRFVILTVPFGIALGMLLAVVAHQRLRGIAVFRTIFSSTIATSVAVASLIFFSLTNPVVGVWNLAPGGIPILENPTWALVAVAAVTIWQSLGLSFIVMSAGLQTIPDELLEAARVDGASSRTVFWRVTLPLLMPTVFFAFVVGSISAFQAFAQIDLLTSGGPLDKTRTLTYDIYDVAINKGNANKAAVLAVGLFVIVLVLTLIQLRLERRVSYDR